MEEELAILCRDVKCNVCVVPLSNKEATLKHYSGKIHSKKVERWKESWMSKKKIKLDNPEPSFPSDIHYGDRVEEEIPRQNSIEVEEKVMPDLSQPIDPRLIDSMDPSTMKKMLSGGKTSSRWDKPKEATESDKKDDEGDTIDDPDDTSIPIDSEKLMKKCFNPTTGVGYCQYCNKLLRGFQEAKKHFSSSKHASKVLTYQELLLSEASILAGTAVAAPPPHRGHYCELCESDCSGQVQLDQHFRGERHRTNVRKMERELVGDPELDKDINPYNLPEVWLRERKHCNLCDIAIFSIRIAKIHFNSRNHRVAAGLNISKASREAFFNNVGDNYCDVCGVHTETTLDMKVHTAGIRHIENERTKTAVEASGGEWNPSNPIPPDPPKYSVQTPPGMEGYMPGIEGWGWGAPMPMPPMMPHMMPMPPTGLHSQMGQSNRIPPLMGLETAPNSGTINEASPGELHCQLCSVSFTSIEDMHQHQEGPSHLEMVQVAASQNEEIPEEESFLPDPLPENPTSFKTSTNPFHCPFCKVWVPTITMLKYYHSLTLQRFSYLRSSLLSLRLWQKRVFVDL